MTLEKYLFKRLSEGDKEASITLENGYRVYVSKGASTYGAPYELFMKPINSKVLDEPIGYLNEKEVLSLINEIKRLPKVKRI